MSSSSSVTSITSSTIRKRPFDEGSPDNNSNNINNADPTGVSQTWPRFIVMEASDPAKSLSSLSPFVIEKSMKGITGEVVSIKKLRSGLLIVEVSREGQAKNLLKQTTFASIPVKVSAHRSLNSSCGVIRNYDLAQMDPAELTSELQSAGVPVTAARNILQTRNGQRKKTAAIIL